MQIYLLKEYSPSVHYVHQLPLVSPVVVPVHLTVLREHFLLNLLLELLLRHEVVLPAVDFPLSGPSCGVADAEFEEVRVLVDEHVDESALSDVMATLPTPEQPVMTRGERRTRSLW